jgi:hypothetical protein
MNITVIFGVDEIEGMIREKLQEKGFVAKGKILPKMTEVSHGDMRDSWTETKFVGFEVNVEEEFK